MIGLLAGYLAGFLGIGGGFVVVPALTWLFLQNSATAPFAVHMAVATSLGTMLVTSLSSIIAHHRRQAISIWEVEEGEEIEHIRRKAEKLAVQSSG